MSTNVFLVFSFCYLPMHSLILLYISVAPPSEALVCRVRELYNRRVSDVRFLIPVLTGLSKKEVIAVLPKLIKLNPHVVKEVTIPNSFL